MHLIPSKTYSSVYHLKNLVLDSIKVLSVTSGGTADDVVDLDVIILSSHTT
jgi:hypothetical protein